MSPILDEPLQQAALDGGVVEFYEVGDGPPLLFAHGALSNAHTWNAVVPLLAEQYRCVVPTLPLGGHRRPMDAAVDLTPYGISRLLFQFLDAVGVDAVTLIGNDTGGAYAQVFAAEHPSRVSKLILSSCDALDVFPPSQFSSLQTAINLPLYADLMALAFRVRPFLSSRWALGLLSNRLSSEELRAHYVDSFVADREVRRDFRKVANGWSAAVTEDAADRLASAQIPTLLLWGGDDELFPASLAQRLHRRLTGSSLVFVEGARTYVQVDQPEHFAERVAEFVGASA